MRQVPGIDEGDGGCGSGGVSISLQAATIAATLALLSLWAAPSDDVAKSDKVTIEQSKHLDRQQHRDRIIDDNTAALETEFAAVPPPTPRLRR